MDSIECQFKTNRLKIKLNGKASSKDEVPSENGTSGSSWRTLDEFQLKFLEGNGIRAKGANIDYSDEFSSGTVLNVKSQQPSDQNEDTDDDEEEEEDEDKGVCNVSQKMWIVYIRDEAITLIHTAFSDLWGIFPGLFRVPFAMDLH